MRLPLAVPQIFCYSKRKKKNEPENETQRNDRLWFESESAPGRDYVFALSFVPHSRKSLEEEKKSITVVEFLFAQEIRAAFVVIR